MRDDQDVYGHMLRDYLDGKGGYEIVERDDGFFSISQGPAVYFSTDEDWPELVRALLRRTRGHVLDVGCGAGRYSLYLQGMGYQVTAIDASPGAIEVCSRQGIVDARVLTASRVSRTLGVFDTVLMLGGSFSFLGSPARAARVIRRLHQATPDAGQIMLQSRDPYQTDVQEHLSYFDLNRSRGRMPGQSRLRVRYKRFVSQWFDYLMLSEAELHQMLEGTGWCLSDVIGYDSGAYAAILSKGGRHDHERACEAGPHPAFCRGEIA